MEKELYSKCQLSTILKKPISHINKIIEKTNIQIQKDDKYKLSDFMFRNMFISKIIVEKNYFVIVESEMNYL